MQTRQQADEACRQPNQDGAWPRQRQGYWQVLANGGDDAEMHDRAQQQAEQRASYADHEQHADVAHWISFGVAPSVFSTPTWSKWRLA